MNGWQAALVAGLAGQGLLALWSWWRMNRSYGPFAHLLSPFQQRLLRWAWLLALLPAAEAWLLWMAGFFARGGC